MNAADQEGGQNLTTLCPDRNRSQTCRCRSSRCAGRGRDLGKAARRRITEEKGKSEGFLPSEGPCGLYASVHLFTDEVELVGDFSVVQLHVHGVAEESQAASGPQHPVGLGEELLPFKPVSRCHGRHQIHLARTKRKLLRWTLPGVKGHTCSSERCRRSSAFLPERHIGRVVLGQSHLQLSGADVNPHDPGEVRRQELRTLARPAAHVHRQPELLRRLRRSSPQECLQPGMVGSMFQGSLHVTQ